MIIPEAVKKALGWCYDVGGSIEYLGKAEDGGEVYYTKLPEDRDIGYPEVNVFYEHTGKVLFYQSHDALQFLDDYISNSGK